MITGFPFCRTVFLSAAVLACCFSALNVHQPSVVEMAEDTLSNVDPTSKVLKKHEALSVIHNWVEAVIAVRHASSARAREHDSHEE